MMSDTGIPYTAQSFKQYVIAAGKGTFEKTISQIISRRNHQEGVCFWFFMETHGIYLLCELLLILYHSYSIDVISNTTNSIC